MSPTAPPEPVGATDADRLSASAEVAAYLEEHVSVRQSGEPCPADVGLDGLVEQGAELTFTCPETVTEVEVGVSMLTDVHEAYRTAAIGDGTTSPDRSLFTIDDDMQTWEFGVRSDTSTLSTSAIAGAVVAALGVVCFVLGAGARRRRSTARGSIGGGEQT